MRSVTNRRTLEERLETRRRANNSYYERHAEEVLRRLSVKRDFDARYQEQLRSNVQNWRLSNPAKKLLQQMRSSADKRGQECTITVEQVEELLAPMTCAETGLPLRWEGRTHDPLAPSPDRLDSGLGYVPGNVRIVAWFINRMRGGMALEEFRELLDMLAQTRKTTA